MTKVIVTLMTFVVFCCLFIYINVNSGLWTCYYSFWWWSRGSEKSVHTFPPSFLPSPSFPLSFLPFVSLHFSILLPLFLPSPPPSSPLFSPLLRQAFTTQLRIVLNSRSFCLSWDHWYVSPHPDFLQCRFTDLTCRFNDTSKVQNCVCVQRSKGFFMPFMSLWLWVLLFLSDSIYQAKMETTAVG